MDFRRLIISVTLAWLTVFVFLPHMLLVGTSFMSPDADHLVVWPTTLANFEKVFTPVYFTVFWHSLELAAIATLVCLLVAYPFAWLLSGFKQRTQAILLFLLILPFWTNSLIRTYAIKIILGKKGLINSALVSMGILDEPVQLLYTEFAVIFGLVYLLLPFMVLPLYSSFDKMDTSLLEAGKDLGANALQRFRHIILPLTMPGIISGCLIVFLPAMGMFYIADLLGGAKNLLLGNVVKNLFLVARDWPMGAAFSVIMMLMMALLLLMYAQANKLVSKKGGLNDENL
ncbi:spermidine/putrescine ABC transporter permease PotB [Oceanospirillum sediminis]|uniref:Spermidine/putrescine ABC transporter permease PotB n=1 Tax=Oceanospirillum sediminis TaxID=2760088 RepID=A0A839IPR9_9GAMM|nr:spermidine/putrescine ABC transporter permease PotB [Oceanospirillum sediminis]MBB1486236.1 spermidine/putrescine ABC transporter permease PotB [Oceanospirillum sediminis]